MANIIQEIRSQPHHVRKIFMWSCTVIVGCLVLVYWVRETRQEFTALLHPNKDLEIANMIQGTKNKNNSIADSFNSAIDNIKASIGDIWGRSTTNNIRNETLPSINPQPLPLAP